MDGRLQRGDGGVDWGRDVNREVGGGGVLEEAVPAMRKIWIPVGKTN